MQIKHYLNYPQEEKIKSKQRVQRGSFLPGQEWKSFVYTKDLKIFPTQNALSIQTATATICNSPIWKWSRLNWEICFSLTLHFQWIRKNRSQTYEWGTISFLLFKLLLYLLNKTCFHQFFSLFSLALFFICSQALSCNGQTNLETHTTLLA